MQHVLVMVQDCKVCPSTASGLSASLFVHDICDLLGKPGFVGSLMLILQRLCGWLCICFASIQGATVELASPHLWLADVGLALLLVTSRPFRT